MLYILYQRVYFLVLLSLGIWEDSILFALMFIYTTRIYV